MFDLQAYAARRPRTVRVFAALLGVGYLALLVLVALTRRPWLDEAMFTHPALLLLEEGYLGNPMFAALFEGAERNTYFLFPLYPVLLAGWFALFGDSLFALRATQIAAGLLMLYSVYRFAAILFQDRSKALVAAAILGLDYFFLVAAGFGRYDILVAALGFGAYFAYLALRRQSLARAILASQTLVCFSGVTHPNGLMYFAGLLFLTLAWDRKRFAWKYVGLAVLPYLIVGSFWAAYVFQDFDGFQAQMGNQASARYAYDHFGELILREARVRYLHPFGLPERASTAYSGPVVLKLFVLAAYAGGVSACLLLPALRRRPGVRTALWLLLIHQTYLTFLEGTKFHFYLVNTIPLFALLLANALTVAWARTRRFHLLLAAGCAFLAVLQLGGVAFRIKNDTYRPFARFARELLERAGPDELVMAPGEVAFFNNFAPGLENDPRLGYRTGKRPKWIGLMDRNDWNFANWKRQSPDLYRFIERRLDEEYELVWREGDYRIYRLRPEAGKATSPRRSGV